MLASVINRAFASGFGKSDPLSNFWYYPVGGMSSAGVPITDGVALSVSTVFACIRVLSDSLGILPCHVYERLGDDGKRKATDHEFYTPIHSRPNNWQTPIDFKSMGVAHLGLRGNFYAEIIPPDVFSDSVQFVPRNPDRMKVEQSSSGRLTYTHTRKDGQQRQIDQDSMLHVKLLCLDGDGIVGASPITYAANSIGMTRARQDMQSKVFKGGGFIKYYLKTTKRMNTEAIANFRAGWKDLHGQGGDSFTPPILEDDMDIKTLGMSMDDLQAIESEKVSAIEICQFYGVPPHMVHILDKATFSNIEQQGIEYKTLHLAPWAVRFEQAFQSHFVQPDRYYAEFMMDALLRGDTQSRYAAYGTALGGRPFMSMNEVRRKENLDPIDGGDEVLEPLNMSVPGQAGKQNRDLSAETKEPTQPKIDLGPVILSTAERIVTREVKGIGSKAKTADRDAFKIAASDWYTNFASYVTDSVFPVALSFGVTDRASIEAWAKSYCSHQLAALLIGDRAATVAEWEANKPKQVAQMIEEQLRCMTEL